MKNESAQIPVRQSKKMLWAIPLIALVLSLAAAPFAYAWHPQDGSNEQTRSAAFIRQGIVAACAGCPGFIDEDGDGICDNWQNGGGYGQGYGNGAGRGFVDDNGDGICDNRQNDGGYGQGNGNGFRGGRGCGMPGRCLQ